MEKILNWIKQHKRATAGILIGLFIVGAAIGGGDQTAQTTSDTRQPTNTSKKVEETSKPRRDFSAILACDEFRSVISDSSNGTLTDKEVREKLVEVNKKASVADDSAVQNGAQEVLAATMSNDLEQFKLSAAELIESCKKHTR